MLVCGGTGCTSSKSPLIIEEFKDKLKKYDLEKEVNVVQTGCFGLCALGPVVVVYPEGSFYSKVTPEDVEEIVSEHLLKGRIVTRLLYEETVQEDTIKSLNETAFYKKQQRVALRNCGIINPEIIDEYIAFDGYAALAKCLTEMTPADVIQCINCLLYTSARISFYRKRIIKKHMKKFIRSDQNIIMNIIQLHLTVLSKAA